MKRYVMDLETFKYGHAVMSPQPVITLVEVPVPFWSRVWYWLTRTALPVFGLGMLWTLWLMLVLRWAAS